MTDRLALVLTALAVLLVGGIVFGPLLPEIATHFYGIEYVDHYGTQWFYWFAQYTLETGQSPAHTDLFFYPWGKDIYGHTGANVLDAYLAIPFRVLLGPILGYNVFLLLGFALSGVAFGFLAREITEDRLAIGVGAVLFTFTPYVLFEAAEGRPTQAILLFQVLFVLFMWRSGARRGLLAPVAAGVMLALSGYQYWYYAFFGGMLALAHGLWRTARPATDAGGAARTFGRHVLMAAVALLLTVPVALPLFTASAEDVVGRFDTSQWSLLQNPPVTLEEMRVSMMAWQPFRRHAGALVEDPDGTERYLTRVALVPIVFYPMLLLWLRRPGKLDRGPMLAMLVMLTALATGPMILISNIVLPNPFYVALAKSLPFVQRLWWPGRAYAFVAILLGLALVAVLADLRAAGPVRQALVAAGVTVAWAVELMVIGFAPYPHWDGTIPAGFECLATGPEGALVELPYGWTQAHLYYQLAHGRPLLGGMIENNPVFTPDESVELREKNTYVKALIEVSMMKSEAPDWTEADKQALYDLGYRYVLMQKDAFDVVLAERTMLDNAMRTRLRRMSRKLADMAGPPVYDDARVAIYAPWGDPAPCDVATHEKDTVRLGRTESSTEELYRQLPEEGVLWRVFQAADDTDTDTDTDTDAADTDTDPPAGPVDEPTADAPPTDAGAPETSDAAKP